MGSDAAYAPLPTENKSHNVCLPWLWPLCVFAHIVQDELQVSFDVFKFIGEAHKLDYELKPAWATPNTTKCDLKTMVLRDFSDKTTQGLPLIIDAPFAGHSATIADYSPDQSLVRTLKKNGLTNVYVTDWKSATDSMKDFTIDTYLKDLDAAVDAVGGKAHLVGICQGGWMITAYAALFPNKVKTLVLAGSPIDTDAGDGVVKKLAHTLPISVYKDLVAAGDGRLLGKFMLAAWKSMNPAAHYIDKYFDLFSHIEDQAYVKRAEDFARWYEAPLDLPGAYYLEVVEQIFKENRLAKGSFIALGEMISLKNITVPVFLLAGDADDITPKEQVFNAENYLGSPRDQIVKKAVPGGHIGLFMGRATLDGTWPEISKWILDYDKNP